MKKYIDKNTLVAEIVEKLQDLIVCKMDAVYVEERVILRAKIDMYKEILSFIDTIEVKEMDLNNRKTDWSPSKKQMESLKDMLKWNIGDFNYQKWMEVNSLYDDLTKILDYEIDRQK